MRLLPVPAARCFGRAACARVERGRSAPPVVLPQDSKNGRIANITPNALNIAGWTSIEMKLNYDQVGKSMVNDWMFLKLADGRLLEVISTGHRYAVINELLQLFVAA